MPTLSIDVTAGQATRICAALGKERNLTDEQGAQRPATNAEVRTWLIDVMKRMVLGNEQRVAVENVAPPAALDIN